MADPHIAFFTDLFGTPVPPTPEGKIEVFRELVSLFDSLHDFGGFGSVYDYITTSKDSIPKYITNKKTIFNHLRNSYTTLSGYPTISFKNSQLHCYSDNFHLKSSLSKAKLEDAFYTYAKDYLYTNATPAIEYTAKDIPYETLTSMFGTTLVFSIDTQKKLTMLTNQLGIDHTLYQTYDMEKVCDPAPHSTTSKDGLHILIEKAGQTRRYSTVPGIDKAELRGFNPEGDSNTQIKIDLKGTNGPVNMVKINAGPKHINNITNVNNKLKASITNFNDMATNKNIKPDLQFYNTTDIKSYSNPLGQLKDYSIEICRILAQKRLGDQLQVVSCMNEIDYTNTKIPLKNTIFVSIDRMAIAFAIANKVNCIYSNRDKLTLFKGGSMTSVEIKVPPVIGSAVSGPKPKKTGQKGGERETWDKFNEQLDKSPYHIMTIFMYTNTNLNGNAKLVQNRFNEFVTSVNTLSTTVLDDGRDIDTIEHTNTNYYIRSFRNNGNGTISIDIPKDNTRDYIVYLKGDWAIYKDGLNITLINIHNTKHYVSFVISAIYGALTGEGEMDTMDGGGSNENKEFLRILAKYEMLILIDDEQMKIWYDIFYTQDNGIPFYSPTFYELNAFFQELFNVNKTINYLSIYTYLQEQPLTHRFAKDLLIILDRILEYMNISTDVFVDPSEHDTAILDKVLDKAKQKSIEYGAALDSLEGSRLSNYIFKNDITPLYFYRVYQQTYFPVNTKPDTPKVSQTRLPFSTYFQHTIAARGGYTGRNKNKKKRRNGSPRRLSRRVFGRSKTTKLTRRLR